QGGFQETDNHEETAPAGVSSLIHRSGEPLVPDWFGHAHPLHISAEQRRQIRRGFDSNGIFLNIPYSPRYSNLEIAILSTVTAYGLVPYMAKDRTTLEIRIQKIVRLMLQCRFGLSDLSYALRLNMPLELGLQLAWGKEVFVVTKKRYRNLRSISDLNFADIHAHEGRPEQLIADLSRWIERNYSTRRLTDSQLKERYRRWLRIRRSLGTDFDRLTPTEIAGMIDIANDEFALQLPEGRPPKTSSKRRK
ncbi:MAG TPA: hypothetical protein VG777_01000, partial [Thermoanaerobaculia bacterium]|nr:hypothetical protein [Thermoanaerobaculia bacterium]